MAETAVYPKYVKYGKDFLKVISEEQAVLCCSQKDSAKIEQISSGIKFADILPFSEPCGQEEFDAELMIATINLAAILF